MVDLGTGSLQQSSLLHLSTLKKPFQKSKFEQCHYRNSSESSYDVITILPYFWSLGPA